MAIYGNGAAMVVAKLKEAVSDEWWAHYQYWAGAMSLESDEFGPVVKELIQHSKDEIEHATELAGLLVWSAGRQAIPRSFGVLDKAGYCGKLYTGSDVISILNDNIAGESCAIKFYSNFLYEFMITG